MTVGPWAPEKLTCLQKYLHAYTTIMRRQSFKGYFYVDVFAGPGSPKVRKELTDSPAQLSLIEAAEGAANDAGEAAYLDGSPRVALSIEPPFTEYVVTELDKQRVRALGPLRNAASELSHSYPLTRLQRLPARVA